MITSNSTSVGQASLWSDKAKAYGELLKTRLSLLVSFSSAFGYAVAMGGKVDWLQLSMLFIGGFLISGASCTINQVLEKDLDKVMKRTANRPLPTSRLNKNEAISFSVIIGIIGLLVLLQWTIDGTIGHSFYGFILICIHAAKKGRTNSCFCRSYSWGFTSTFRMDSRHRYDLS